MEEEYIKMDVFAIIIARQYSLGLVQTAWHRTSFTKAMVLVEK